MLPVACSSAVSKGRVWCMCLASNFEERNSWLHNQAPTLLLGTTFPFMPDICSRNLPTSSPIRAGNVGLTWQEPFQVPVSHTVHFTPASHTCMQPPRLSQAYLVTNPTCPHTCHHVAGRSRATLLLHRHPVVAQHRHRQQWSRPGCGVSLAA